MAIGAWDNSYVVSNPFSRYMVPFPEQNRINLLNIASQIISSENIFRVPVSPMAAASYSLLFLYLRLVGMDLSAIHRRRSTKERHSAIISHTCGLT